MKKICTLFVMGAAVLTAGAQVVEGNKFFDNWSIGVFGGGVAPTVHHSIIGDTRGVAGLELTKKITPVVGVGVQAVGGFNTLGIHQKGADDMIDNVNTTLFGTFNLNNLFGGYRGAPRVFEVEALAGIGFNHYASVEGSGSSNSMTSKLGLNANFNLGKAKAWTVSLKPAIVYDLEGDRGNAQYNINTSVLELTAGVTYHFKGSNGAHHFTLAKLYDQGEVDGLNAKINDLRGELSDANGQVATANNQIRSLQQQLNEARNKKPIVEQVVKVNNKHSLESVVTFRQGKSVVDASQLPNVERIAVYMKNHKGSKVVILGYASPEGSKEINDRLALARAEAVRSILVKKYGIASERITAKGQGVGYMFEEPDWNRVSICTINDANK